MVKHVEIPIRKLFLDSENPRKELETQEEIIEYLCNDEKVVRLAEDIAQIGLNPLELIGVMKNGNGIWIPLEGNRRVCAIKLLSDPELAPSRLKRKFLVLHDRLKESFDKIPCIQFENRGEAEPWLDRMHQGEQEGLGRVQWNAVQKTRRAMRLGDHPKDELALQVLDYAVKQGWFNEGDEEGKLTTVTRYLSNSALRESLGLKTQGNEIITTQGSRLKKFINDLGVSKVGEGIHSRADSSEIEQYAEELIKGDKEESALEAIPHLISAPAEVYQEIPALEPRAIEFKKPRKPKSVLNEDHMFAEALEKWDNAKLRDFYFSIIKVNVAQTKLIPLVTVGCWSLVESIASDLGKPSGKEYPFPKFLNQLSQNKNYQDQERDKGKSTRKDVNAALEELSKLGNLTKHSKSYANYNAEALINDMTLITPLLTFLLKDAPQ